MCYKKIIQYFILTSLMFILNSCGDLFMQKHEEKKNFEQFKQCEMDTSALSLIMVKNINEELICLEKNLNLFINIVKTDRPGNLSLKELKLFINKHMSDVDPELTQSLDVIFELNSVILGDHKHYISKTNVTKLSNLLREFNEIMVDNQVVDFFKDSKNLTFKEYKFRRYKVFEAISYISKVLSSIPTANENTAQINILNVVSTFKKEFDTQTFSNISKMLFLKRIFLGGDQSFLNANEAKRLVRILTDIVTVSYDATHLYLVEDIADNELEFIKILRDIFRAIDRSIYSEFKYDDKVLKLNDIEKLLLLYLPESKNYLKYKEEMLNLKKLLIGSDKDYFTYKELKELTSNILLENFEKGIFFYETFFQNELILTQGLQVPFDLNSFLNLNSKQTTYLEDFNRIIKSYRFLKGKSVSPIYQKFVKRDPLGLFFISFVEELVLRVIKTYGNKDENSLGGYHLTFEQIQTFLKDFKELLINEKLLHPARLLKTSETIFLMSGIFQSNSDGDIFIERDELVQFVSTIISSIEIKKILYEKVTKYCELDEKGRFSPVCFRKSFHNLLNERDHNNAPLHNYFPRLMEFLNTLDNDQQSEYIKSLEYFSRNCVEYEGKEIQMGEDDIFQIFGGIQSVEQTMVRFDDDENNILEHSEVDNAFEVYKDSIINMIPDPSLNSYAKTFFLYLLRYNKLPEKDFSFYKFLASSDKYTASNRFTLAAILKTLSDRSVATPFPCHTLVD